MHDVSRVCCSWCNTANAAKAAKAATHNTIYCVSTEQAVAFCCHEGTVVNTDGNSRATCTVARCSVIPQESQKHEWSVTSESYLCGDKS